MINGFTIFGLKIYFYALIIIAGALLYLDKTVNVTEGDTLFTKWAGQGVEAIVPRTTRMASPSRDVLLALLLGLLVFPAMLMLPGGPGRRQRVLGCFRRGMPRPGFANCAAQCSER